MSQAIADLGLVGDGYDVEPLLTAADVAAILKVPVKSVYELPIPRVKISRRRIRWQPQEVLQFIERRTRQD
jgi:predicted DNA-binding transcriptional regulator AlpA